MSFKNGSCEAQGVVHLLDYFCFTFLFLETNLNIITTQWQIQKSVDKINTNSSKATSLKNSLLSDTIRRVLNHEEKVSSKGLETKFRRNDDKSAEIGRKYRIMKGLQSEETKLSGNKNASFVSRTQYSKQCQNLTAESTKCLSNCTPSYPYRSINGCCNNLESPTQGIISFKFSHLFQTISLLFHRHGKYRISKTSTARLL